MYRFKISLLFALITVLSYSQSYMSNEKIHWTENPLYQLSYEYNYMFYFENADYMDENHTLPYFSKKIKLKIDEDIDNLNIIINSTIPFSTNQKVKNTELISESIQPKYKVLYDQKIPYLIVSFIPITKSADNQFNLISDFTIQYNVRKKQNIIRAKKTYATTSKLASGKWYKISTTQDGIYKLTYDEIIGLGFTNPVGIKLYGYGGGMLPINNASFSYDDLVENAIYFEKGTDGVFNSGDYILFYGESPDKWNFDYSNNKYTHAIHNYSSETSYFITEGTPKTITSTPSSSASTTNTVVNYDAFQFHESESVNLIKSGSQWYGEHFDIYTEYDFDFTFPNINTSQLVKIRTNAIARASQQTDFTVKYNNQEIQNLACSAVNLSSYTADYASSSTDQADFTASSGNINIKVIYNKPANNNDAEGWLNYIELQTRNNLIFSSAQILFRDIESVGAGNISEFIITNSNSNTKIWDISDPTNVFEISSNYSSNTTSFKTETDTLREFIAFDGSSYLTPLFVSEIQNQNLHGLSQQDMVIISHPDFLSYATTLANMHENNDNLSVVVVTQQQIFNEFSSGMRDISAIRNFMRMFYDRSTSSEDMPKYLLLFGDGSYNNRDNSSSNTNYILTYQSGNSLRPTASYVTDDFFGLLDETEGGSTGYVDIGIGRIPVKSVNEAQNAISKIQHYTEHTTMGDWRNMICFIGDDEDGNQHMIQANNLATKVDTMHPVFNIEKIYLDAYAQESTPAGERYPDVNQAINNRVKRGALIINYTGHGNEVGLAHEQILDVNDINDWENYDNMPVFITATCEFSRFDDYERTSAGEQIFLNPNGGGIALLTTTRLVYSTPNYVLNDAFYSHAFEKNSNDEYHRLGDLMRLTKINAGTGTNKRNFTLLGDPALKMAMPKEHISTISINNVNVSSVPDTLKALSKVTITGQVQDKSGQKLSGYNGILYPTVYDKKDSITTLSNNGLAPFTFLSQNHVLFKGKASVTNGTFSFSFVVPKDISYRIDFGKISYYADNSENGSGAYIDATGFNKNIIIGGSSDSIGTDNIGPKIKLFLNDTNFVYGGITDENPLFIANVFDENGINTVGNGIGHDIVATLDDNTNAQDVLNDYYESNLDSYKSGKIEYNYYELEKGIHKINLKVWDVYNNSSVESIEFLVAESSELVLDHVFNYPNPFTTKTAFYFDHNQPTSSLDVLIQVFTITGKIVKTISTTVTSDGYRSDPIPWDGLDDYGDKIGRGVYVYRLKVRTPNGNIVDKFEKLVILK